MSRQALRSLNRSRKAESRRKAEEAISMEIQGKNRAEVADALHVAPTAVSRLKTRYLAERQTEMLEEDLDDLQGLWDEVQVRRRSGKPLSLGCVDRLCKLLEIRIKLRGTAAPTKSVHAHVDAPTDVRFLKFKKAVSDLTDLQLDTVYAFAQGLPREKVERVRDASWFPAAEKLLTEGDDDAA